MLKLYILDFAGMNMVRNNLNIFDNSLVYITPNICQER